MSFQVLRIVSLYAAIGNKSNCFEEIARNENQKRFASIMIVEISHPLADVTQRNPLAIPLERE
jgi:hypothetical protein